MKKLLFGMVIMVMMTMPVMAEIVMFEDDYVSFDYDNEVLSSISMSVHDDGYMPALSYSASFQMMNDTDAPSVYISTFIPTDDWPDSFQAKDEVTVVAEKPLEMLYTYDDGKLYTKIIGSSGDYLLKAEVYLPDTPSELNGAALTIYDSITVKDKFSNTSFPLSGFTLNTIYKNVLYSDKAIAYAKQAINICDGYLTVKISADEAGDRMSSIEDASKELEDETGFRFDSDLYYAIMLANIYFMTNDDAKIVDLKTQFEEIAGE